MQSKTTSLEKSRPEPIPLRTLIVLLKHELNAFDPKWSTTRLKDTTFLEDSEVREKRAQLMENFKQDPAGPKKEMHMLHQDTRNPPKPGSITSAASTGFFHPESNAYYAKDILGKRSEEIFQITRNNGRCYTAAQLFKEFLALCPKEQKLSFRLDREDKLIEVAIDSCEVEEYQVSGAKSKIYIALYRNDHRTPELYRAEPDGSSNHVIIRIPHPSQSTPIVADMTSMQYGNDAGRGLYGEPYIMSTYSQWEERMLKFHDGLELEFKGNLLSGKVPGHINSVGEDLLWGWAGNAWEKWRKRASFPWCAYCGIGAADIEGKEKMVHCCRVVNYCCTEHQKFHLGVHQQDCQSLPTEGKNNE